MQGCVGLLMNAFCERSGEESVMFLQGFCEGDGSV